VALLIEEEGKGIVPSQKSLRRGCDPIGQKENPVLPLEKDMLWRFSRTQHGHNWIHAVALGHHLTLVYLVDW
jgi:hypothetical protein